MRPSRLGRGLASLIHEVPNLPIDLPIPMSLPISEAPSEPRTLPGSWPSEHPNALTPTPLRAHVRSSLEKLSTRPRMGLKSARAYLDHLRQVDGRTSIDLNLSGVDFTSCTMIQLQKGRVVDSIRHSFFGLVSIWK